MKSRTSAAVAALAIIAAFVAGTYFPGAFSTQRVYAESDVQMRAIARKSKNEDAVIGIVPQVVPGADKVRLWVTAYATDAEGRLRMSGAEPVQIAVPDENTLYLGCTFEDGLKLKAIGVRNAQSD